MNGFKDITQNVNFNLENIDPLTDLEVYYFN